MTGTIIALTAVSAVSVGLLVYTALQHSRLEQAYYDLRKVNKILQQRLANSEERPF
jgi:hypothetical protein